MDGADWRVISSFKHSGHRQQRRNVARPGCTGQAFLMGMVCRRLFCCKSKSISQIHISCSISLLLLRVSILNWQNHKRGLSNCNNKKTYAGVPRQP